MLETLDPPRQAKVILWGEIFHVKDYGEKTVVSFPQKLDFINSTLPALTLLILSQANEPSASSVPPPGVEPGFRV